MAVMENEKEGKEVCEKCRGTGIIKEKDGSCHTCWDCMIAGRLDQHSKKLPEHNIKL